MIEDLTTRLTISLAFFVFVLAFVILCAVVCYFLGPLLDEFDDEIKEREQ